MKMLEEIRYDLSNIAIDLAKIERDLERESE